MIKYKIKERREKLGMSQAELIRKTGLSRATISALENGGRVDIKVSTLNTLASALKCSVGYLFE
jgi:transcriptional regulator with XRE-family HTH domain